MTERQRDRTKANPHARGTSNGNERGNTVTRRQRKQWLIDNYPSNITAIRITYADLQMEWPNSRFPTALIGQQETYYPDPENFQACLNTQYSIQRIHKYIVRIETLPCTRCYYCGVPLHIETVTVDRIKPGVLGGKYRTPRMDTREGVTNVRPACARHNSSTGAALANSKKHAPAKKRAALKSVL